MRKFTLLSVVAILASASLFGQSLIFSEYIEGSSNNKAIEIYNSSTSTINLANFTIVQFNNGASRSSGTRFALTFTNPTLLLPGSTYVIANSSASAGVTSLANLTTTNSVMNFNGDDALAIYLASDVTGTTIAGGAVEIDIFGRIGTDPGTEWGTLLQSTADNTIRRKSTIYSGVTTNPAVFTPSDEYDGFATDVFSGLGSHTMGTTYAVNTTLPARTYTDITVNGAGITVDFAGPSRISKTLTVTDGTLSSAGNLTLQSTIIGTAMVANSAGSITGDVTVERFIPANTNRAWRLLSVPTTGTQTIAASWKANTWITTANATDDADAITKGFDAKTPGHSMQYFTGTGLSGVALGTDVLSAQPAYFLFVRGDRTSDHTNATVTATTLSSTGTINQGSITRGTAGTGGAGFSLIPNPYPSNIDFEALRTGNGSSINTFYIWDANLNTVGGYRTVTRTEGPLTYTVTPPGSADANSRYIQSGQAFWIGSEQQLNFTESMKTSSAPTTNVFRTSNITEGLAINLSIKHGNGTYFLADGVRSNYDNSYNAAVTAEDVKKLSNFNENLAINRTGNNMAIENRPIISTNDTIFLKLWNTGVKEYRFTINPTNFSTGLNAYLEDAYLNTSTPVSLTAATDVDFAITSDAGSQNIDRFRIVFRPSSVMPVSFTSIKAYEKANAIEVAWNVAGESDIHHYEVEKSADGRNFSMMTSVKAKGNENGSVAYLSLDNAPVNGNNYYRVKSVSLANEVKYTSTVNVRLGKNGEAVSVYPNPVKGNTVGLQLTNLEKGSYTLKVYNSTGQLVVTKMIQHGGGSASEQLILPASSIKGVYQLEVKGERNRFVQQIILQ